MNRYLAACIGGCIALTLTISAQAPPARSTGSQHREYVFTPTGQQMPYRVYVPKTCTGRMSNSARARYICWTIGSLIHA